MLAEKHADEQRRREAAAQAEQAAIEQDQLRRAQIWRGVPASMIPEGVSAAAAMMQADYDTRPRRRSVLEDALSNSGTTFHSFRSAPDES